MIRKMTMDDVSQVAKLEKMIFTDPWSENVYRQTLELAEVAYLVVEIDGKLVGASGIRNICGDGEITNVMIHPDYRGKGYSKTMLMELLEEGKRLGAENFTLEVRRGNQVAISLYKSLGFVEEGIRPNFYEHPKEDAVIMWMR